LPHSEADDGQQGTWNDEPSAWDEQAQATFGLRRLRRRWRNRGSWQRLPLPGIDDRRGRYRRGGRWRHRGGDLGIDRPPWRRRSLLGGAR